MPPSYPGPTTDLPAVEELPDSSTAPDLLRMRDGERVGSPSAWWERRRPELQQLLQHYIYGYLPAPVELTPSEERSASPFDGRATLREVTLTLPRGETSVRLLLILPRESPAPVFLGLNKCGNHTVLEHEAIAKPSGWVHPVCQDTSRGDNADVWCIETLIDRGYGLATMDCAAVAPDDAEATGGFDEALPAPGPVASRRGVIATWAWGLHRAVDHLQRVDDVGAVAAIGHSRRGKAALLAAAMDRRIDLVVPHQSGVGGLPLARSCEDDVHYTVAHTTTNHPYWYAERFGAFASRETRLPLDMDALPALVAPRPVFDTEGLRDMGANYVGALDALRSAAPVYELLGEDIGRVPLLERESVHAAAPGPIAQYRLDTEHVLHREYWEAILEFADRHC